MIDLTPEQWQAQAEAIRRAAQAFGEARRQLPASWPLSSHNAP